MAKKSQRRPVRYDKDQSGCMWGFISMFDFRHARSTRKLIADKRRTSKHAVGSVHSKNKFEMLSNLGEDFQGNRDGGESKRPTLKSDSNKPSVKKLIEEEMFIDQDAMKDKDNAEVESKESKLGHEDPSKIDSKRKKKSRKKSRDMDTHDLNSDEMVKLELSRNQHSRQQPKDNIDLDKIMEEFCHLRSACSVMHDHDGEVHAQSNQKHVIAENKARDAIHQLVNQMIFNGNDLAEARKFLCSHELMEAFQLISSDKELFLRLLEDPNSLLLKYVQELGNAQGKNDKEYKSVIGSNLSEQGPGSLRQTREVVNHKQRNFFRKKVKSQAKNPTNGYVDSENRIVILKPGPMGLRNSESENNLASSIDSHGDVRYKGPSMRVGSHFSLTEIKKKLKHAMGKEKRGNPDKVLEELPAERKNMGQGSKFIGRDNVGMRSPNKDHFFIEKIARPIFDAKKGDKNGTFKDSEVILEHENGNPKKRVPNIYIEAKKHLCEILDGDEDMDFSSRQIPKSLGRILSLPEYNFSPLGSPERDWENNFVTAQTRFSGAEKYREANEDILSPRQEALTDRLDQATKNPEKSSVCDEISDDKVQGINSRLNFSDDFIHDEKGETSSHVVRDDIIDEGNVESTKEINVLDSSSELVGLVEGKDQNIEISEISDCARHSQCLNQDVLDKNQLPSSPVSSPSHCSITKKIVELESRADVSGRPSPVSVLDTPFLEDDISHGSTGIQPVKVPIRPLQIQFEEHDSSPMNQIKRGKHCVEENVFIFDYIQAILQASGLNRDQLWIKCLSSDQILDPSLFDQVEFFTDQPCHDQKLLFDCINEVLMEVCCHYFGVSPWVSFVKSSIRPIPNMKMAILKVWEVVCWHFLPLPPPHTLDQIVGKDVARSVAWMDLQFDAEIVGFEMGEAILEELMEETIFSCISESSESKCSQLPFELKVEGQGEQHQHVEHN
ncbi:hypothetical protein L6164_003885 [Bauhinia variegata]|uniref:Uncharacterized protein n=1 Tax=Bauhinia variegata TaxID=167791 RepID=A0ACB9Q268_BAUVA|nr:hypothetical protein L6164_003885 [Bauhinia variegata]